MESQTETKTEAKPEPPKPKAKLNTFWKLTEGQRIRYGGSMVTLATGTVLLYASPLIIGATLDAVLGNKDESIPQLMRGLYASVGGRETVRAHLWVVAILVPFVTALSGIFMYLKNRWAAIASEEITRSLRNNLYNHLQHLPCSYHDRAQTGDLVQRCTSDVETVRLFYSNQIVEIVRALVLLVTALPIIFWLDWKMSLVAIVLLPVITVFAIIFFGRSKDSFKAMDEAEGKLTTVIQENLTGIRVVRAFARQQFERQKFAKVNAIHRDLNIRFFQVMALFWSFSDFLCFMQTSLVLLIGAYRVSNGSLTIGTLVTFQTYVGIYLWPVRQMGRVLSETGKAVVAMGRIEEVLNEPEESSPEAAQQVAAKSTQSDRANGEIVLQNVSFKHREQTVLDDVSFTVPAGKTYALLGPSGAGKSTIIHLLLRFYDPTSGRISIDGQDLASLPRKWVREQFGVVMQEPFLYSKNLRDNIRLGRFSAGEGEVVEAATIANIHESIVSFEKQYDTLVGERGVTLSGGQRQRVAIARAILKDAPVLVLDDALSAVDTQTETMILDALKARAGKHTTLLIAHRLSTLMHADRILVIEHGKVVQSGTHEELSNVEGLYQRLWQIQSALEDDLRAELEQPEAVESK